MSRYSNAEDRTIYSVIVNNSGQYSLWPANEALPRGWTSVGKTGTRRECLAYIGAQMRTGQSEIVGRSAEGTGSE
jgi:uncharacterized protein YbdZ (MbtH family)